MAEYWDKCEKARSLADRYAVESVKKASTTKSWKWWEPLNKLADKMLGVSDHYPWTSQINRPIAFGAPEYKSLIKKPAIIRRVWDETSVRTQILYLLIKGRAVLFSGYADYPFYMLWRVTKGEHPMAIDLDAYSKHGPEFMSRNTEYILYTKLDYGGYPAGIMIKPHQHHEQRMASFILFTALTFYTTYRKGRNYIILSPQKSGNHKKYVELLMGYEGIALYPVIESIMPVIPPNKKPVEPDVLYDMWLVYTPCEVLDALQLMSRKFSLVFYESPELGGLVLVDKDYLKEVIRRGDALNVVVIEANNTDKAEDGAELLAVYRHIISPRELKGDPITLDEIDSPSALYDTTVLARLG